MYITTKKVDDGMKNNISVSAYILKIQLLK